MTASFFFPLLIITPKNCFLLYLDTSPSSIENQTRSNKNTLLTQLLQTVKKTSPNEERESAKPKSNYSIPQTVKKSSPNDEPDIEKSKSNYSIPKTEPPPAPKAINKARINEFASLLSSSVHLSQPQSNKKSITPQTPQTRSSPPTRSDEPSFSSIPSISTDRDERESYHTVKSNSSEQEQTKRHIDARYNDGRLDDRGSIKINTANNIKALFEQKIFDTNKTLSQSHEHLSHSSEVRQQYQHKKVPVSYETLKKKLPNYQQTVSNNNNNNNRRKTYQDTSTMNKYTDHISGTKDVVIEDKQVEFRLC